MALLFMDSFDHYATAELLGTKKWGAPLVSGAGSTLVISPTGGRRGSACMRWTTGTALNPQGAVGTIIGGGDTTMVAGFGFRTSGAPGIWGMQIMGAWGTSAAQLHLRLNPDLTVSVMRGAHGTGTELGTTTIPLSPSMYTFVELKVLVANSGGTIELRFDGQMVVSVTGLDTQETATAGWNSVFFGQINNISNTNTTSRTIDYDDFYLCDGTGPAPWNNFLGDCRIDALLPTAAGATTGWTPSTGANYAAVDDPTPNDDTDYTKTGSVALSGAVTDTFVFPDAVVGKPIHGIQHCVTMKRSNESHGLVALVIRHAGVDYVGADILPSFTGYGCSTQRAVINPGTGVAWTEADFNAAEFGYKRTF